MRSILKLPVVCLGFLLSAACAHAGAGTGIPDAILNQGTAQNAQINIGTAVVRGTVTASTAAVHTLKFDDNSFLRSANGLAGSSSPYVSAIATTTLSNPFGTTMSTLTITADSQDSRTGPLLLNAAYFFSNPAVTIRNTSGFNADYEDVIQFQGWRSLSDPLAGKDVWGDLWAKSGQIGIDGKSNIGVIHGVSYDFRPSDPIVTYSAGDNWFFNFDGTTCDAPGASQCIEYRTSGPLPSQREFKFMGTNLSFFGQATFNDTITAASGLTASTLAITGLPGAGVLFADAAGHVSTTSVSLTSLNASNLTSGTVPDARFPSTLPAVSGAALTNLNASNLGSGTVPDARFPATLPAASGANLTALNASNLSTGRIPTFAMPALVGAVTMAAGSTTTVLNIQISPSTGIAAGVLASNVVASSVAVAAVGDAQITGMAASKLTGTITSAQLPALTGAITSSAGSNVTSFNGLISPSTGIAAGILASNVQASSVAANAVGDAQISAVAGSKVSGNITGSAANVTGTVAVANGGTGLTTIATGQLLIGNGPGSVAAAFLTAGTNVQITTGVGSITIAASTAGAGPFTGAVSSTSISMNSFAINNVSTNSWTNATINGATTYWQTPPTTSTSTFFPMFTGTQVSYPQVMTGVNQNTSSNTISGYRVFQSTVVLPTSAAPTVDQAGAIGFDTTDKQYIGHNGTEQFVIGHATQVATVFIASGTGSGSGFDSMTIPFFEVSPDQPILIRSIDSAAMGGTSVTFNIEKRANTSLSSAGVNATGSAIVATTGVTHTSAFSSASAAKSAWLVLTTSSSAGSGAVTGLVVTINYTDTVE